MQCASAGPVRLVLSSATTPPTRVTPSHSAMNSGRFGIIRQTRVALAEALRERPAGVAVGARGELAIAEAARGRTAAPARRRTCRPAPRSRRKDARRVLGDRRRHLQGAQRAPRDRRRRPSSRSINPMAIPSHRSKHCRRDSQRAHSAKHRAAGAKVASVRDATDRRRRTAPAGCRASAARSGWSGAPAPRKASNRRVTASGSRSRVISTMRVRWSSSGQRGSRTGG